MELIMDDWSKEEDKAFENALANYPQNWEQVVANLTGKSLEEINRHYVNLIDDVNRIESGIVPLPDYDDAYRSAKQCRRGTTWSDDEHRLFLEGLDKYGWGDWRSISRNCVVTRTPTQVASHAQKYNLRLSSKGEKKARRRSSILDITRVKNGDNSAPKGPITGQAIDSAATPSGIYAAPGIEQPIGGPPVSAVGTRVNLTFSELMAYDGLGPDY